MGQIRKRKGLSDGIPSVGDEDDNKHIKHCPHCNGQLVPSFDENYKNCRGCGRTGIPVYEAKSASELEGFTDPSDNPFDYSGRVIGLDNKRPRSRYDRERQAFLDKRDEIAEIDPDIANEMRKGNTVRILEDSTGQLGLGDI